MDNTNVKSAAIAQAAREIVNTHAGAPRIVLVNLLTDATKCHPSTARRHIITALSGRIPRTRGGKQPGAGRPKKLVETTINE